MLILYFLDKESFLFLFLFRYPIFEPIIQTLSKRVLRDNLSVMSIKLSATNCCCFKTSEILSALTAIPRTFSPLSLCLKSYKILTSSPSPFKLGRVKGTAFKFSANLKFIQKLFDENFRFLRIFKKKTQLSLQFSNNLKHFSNTFSLLRLKSYKIQQIFLGIPSIISKHMT